MKSIRFTLMNALLLAASTSVLFAADQQPNIIVLFADDLGYGELSCQGNPEIPTPILTRLPAMACVLPTAM